MVIMNELTEPKYNCLFLPGLPGKIKDLAVFEDITATGGQIHWLQYAGSYEHQDGTNLSIASVTNEIKAALEELGKQSLPILVIAYSFSTAILPTIDLTAYPHIFGAAFFSPIRGLSSQIINEDMAETLSELVASGDVTAKLTEWTQEALAASDLHYNESLEKLTSYTFPVAFAYSLGDTTIKVDDLQKDISHFRQQHTYNSLLVFEQTRGYHRLDTYYTTAIGNFFRSLEIELDLIQLLHEDIFVYLWGSSLNYNYSGEDSDIDLLVFYDGYVDQYRTLNKYVEEYNAAHDIAFDLSINDKKDLLSKKIFRYNRGPVAIHELNYAYFPLKRATEILDIPWSDITKDAYNASIILAGESKKILSKCDLSNARVKKIIKYSITVYTYLLYIRGDKNLDLNHVESYIKISDLFGSLISRSIELKRTNYEGMTLDDLYDAVRAIDLIIQEQESILGISW